MARNNETQRTTSAELPQLARQLDELREAHARLLAAMADLDAITRSTLRNETYMHVRFRLSAASLARRRLWQEIFRALDPVVGDEDAAVLRELQDGDLQLLRLSSKHVGTWTTEAVAARWVEYSQASRQIRGHLKDAIRKEQRLLYPLLAKYAHESSGARGKDDQARTAA